MSTLSRDITDNVWFALLASPEVGIAGLRHIVAEQDARICHLHFVTPASAYGRGPLREVHGNTTIVQSTSVNGRWTRYHEDRHYPGQPCHNDDVPVPPPPLT
ncbi:hypothetical protein DM01DRAFT_1383417 [Hesseltinella vesiculosa]|uniref:Uncharacterized protein n=1 Tax=Hesseltinella vesiculosa TaxID=101127 RepID=A0A1X2GHR3_9FUNG|nr:hypothetical protein DM01DRAFT_1383417 [Hesseltinella vesiculosa]